MGKLVIQTAQQSWTADDVMEEMKTINNTAQQSWTAKEMMEEVKTMMCVQTICVLDEAC